jgi:mercuric ion binding protein
MKNMLTLLLLLLNAGSLHAQDPDGLVALNIRTNAVCDMCVNTIQSELIYEKGVKAVVVDLDSNIVRVRMDPKRTNAAKVRKALAGLGYAADDLAPDAKARAALPACCQKEGCGMPKKPE